MGPSEAIQNPKVLGAGVKGAESLAYCTFGAACTEVELDMLTGEQRVLRSDILFDCGRSINPALDMGQVRVIHFMECIYP